MSFLLLELLVGSIIARCAVVILTAFRTVSAPIVPSPAVSVLPVHVAIAVPKSPSVLRFNPVAPTSLIPDVVRIACGHPGTDPSPAFAGTPVHVAIEVAEEPFVSFLNPMAAASLVPFARFGSGHWGL